MKERGTYRLELACRSSAETPDLAQLPLSIFQDRELVKTVFLTGADKDWKKQTIELTTQPIGNTFYIKLFFGQGGMEIKDCEIAFVEPLN